MTTGDEVLERALSLAADASLTDEDAIAELLDCCAGRRVSLVVARQRIEDALKASPDDPAIERSVSLLDGALGRGSWDVA